LTSSSFSSLIIDQIYDSDYKHLRPKKDDLFSDDEEENDDEEEGGVKREEEDLEDMEMNRRRQLEEEFGLDSNQQTVVRLYSPFLLPS